MKLLTKEIISKLPKLYSQEKVKDPICSLKFFTPDSSFTWYIIEGEYRGEGEEKDFLMFGKVISHLCPDGELGYVSFNEISQVKGPFGLGVERDKWWKPQPLSQCK